MVPKKLLIHKYKNDILNKLDKNRVLIITGETGCGKSTQLPKYLHEVGYTDRKKVACLHPRRLGAKSLAERVSYELNSEIGCLVGYRIRFDCKFKKTTKIIFMTTAFMLGLTLNDYDLRINEYGVIIIDEAHERVIETDIMLGKMKLILDQCKNMKLIIMSATLNVNKFMNFYRGAGLVEITEKSNAVDVIYRPLMSQDYINEIVILVREIIKKPNKGDILIFLPSELKVRQCSKKLKSLSGSVVFKLFSAMDYEDKSKVFQNFEGKTKIVVSTNIAELSITIPGVDYVIDLGAVKRVSFDHAKWSETWMTTYISKIEAEQRKGRTGRTGKGTCYRLYEESFMEHCSEACSEIENHHYIEFPYFRSSKDQNRNRNKIKHFIPFPRPQILDGNLAKMILTIKIMGIFNVIEFPFIDPPDSKKVKSVTLQLLHLSLLSKNKKVTPLGRSVSSLPLEPRLGKCLIVGWSSPSRDDICIIVAMLSCRYLLKKNKKSIPFFKELERDDIFLLLCLYKMGIGCKFSKEWCKKHFISFDNMKSALKICKQLKEKCNQIIWTQEIFDFYNSWNIQYAFLSGFVFNIAKQMGCHYQAMTGYENAEIDRWSCLKHSNKVIIYQTAHCFLGNKIVLRECLELDIDLLLGLASWESCSIKRHLLEGILNFLSIYVRRRQ